VPIEEEEEEEDIIDARCNHEEPSPSFLESLKTLKH
jgi:hypothetical protein